MRSWSLEDVRSAMARVLGEGTPPMGVGVRPFPRLGPALFLPGYRIFCSAITDDLSDIRGLTAVDCLQERLSCSSSPCPDTLSLLSHPLTEREIIRPGSRAGLLIYRETPEIRAMAEARGWRLLANPSAVRARWENKAWFRGRLREAGLPAAPGEIVSLNGLGSCGTLLRFRQPDRGLVVQIPDFPRGGGRSTFFVNDALELDPLQRRLGAGKHGGHCFHEVLVSPYIDGPSLSMEGCVTPWGVLLSPLQTQLVDLPEVLPAGPGGRFCGHQWGAPTYPPEAANAANAVALWVGEALRTEGYAGIFGIDFALDRRTGELFALECNPRYTGAFPTLTLLQMATGVPPMEAFHVLAFLGSKTPVPVDGINQQALHIPPAAQILLFHRRRSPSAVRGALRAGRYRVKSLSQAASWVGPSYPFPAPPWDSGEFLVLDGPPPRETVLPPGDGLERVVRLLFFRAVLGADGRLEPEIAAVIRWVYHELGIEQNPEGSP